MTTVQNFSYYKDLVDYPINACDNQPKLDYVWYAYKGGEAKTFTTESEARKFSKMVERTTTIESKEAHKKYWDDLSEKESKAFDMWYSDVLNNFNDNYDFTEKQLDKIYGQAYEDAHSSGYDSVFEKMIHYADFITGFNEHTP